MRYDERLANYLVLGTTKLFTFLPIYITIILNQFRKVFNMTSDIYQFEDCPSWKLQALTTDLHHKQSYFGSAETLTALVNMNQTLGTSQIFDTQLSSKQAIEVLRHSLELEGKKLYKTQGRYATNRLQMFKSLLRDPLLASITFTFDDTTTRSMKYISSDAVEYFIDMKLDEVKPMASGPAKALISMSLIKDLQSQTASQISSSQPVAQTLPDGTLTPEQRAANAAAYQEMVIAEAMKVRDSQPIYQMSQRNKDNDLEMLETTEYKGGQGHFPIINYDDSFNAFDNDDARLTHFDMFCNPKELEKARKSRPDAVRAVIDKSELDGVYREYNRDYCQVDFRDLIMTNYLREGFEREDTEFREMSIEIMRAMTEIFRTYDLVGVFYSKIYNEMLMNFKQAINFQSLFDAVTNYLSTHTDRFPVWGKFADELIENNELDGLNPPTANDFEFYILNYRAAFIYVVNMILEGHYKPSIVDPTAEDIPDVHGIFTEILMCMTADATADRKLNYEKVYELYLDDQFDRLMLRFGERGLTCYPNFRHFVPFNQIEENESINIGIIVPIYAFNGNDRYLAAISRYKNTLEKIKSNL